MSARITLTATAGALAGLEFVFNDWTVCTIGRSPDCLICVQGEGDLTASRRHCLLTVDPPFVRVRDLGSLNGTFLNGRRIGQRGKGTPSREALPVELEAVELHDGDLLSVGNNAFLVRVECTARAPALVGEPTDFAACC